MYGHIENFPKNFFSIYGGYSPKGGRVYKNKKPLFEGGGIIIFLSDEILDT